MRLSRQSIFRGTLVSMNPMTTIAVLFCIGFCDLTNLMADGGTNETITITLPGNVPLEMVKIPAGTFQMGDISGGHANDERPVHSVTISKPFYLGKYQVTQAQWRAVMNANPSGFPGDNRPVENVSWNDIQSFCQAVKTQTNYAVRLPTEAEWEYACRAGSTTDYFFGNEASQLGNYSWYGNNSGNVTHDVGGKQPNAWGLYDINGNVYEWCHDWYGAYSAASQMDPTGAVGGTLRVLRGGSCYSGPDAQRCSFRSYYAPDYKENSFGFRLALSVADIITIMLPGNVPLEMVKIPAGTFQMGDISGVGLSNERPVHAVTISKPFYMSKYKVTQAQWRAVMNNNPSQYIGDLLPVHRISWDNAQSFCTNVQTQTGYAVRLPTEAQWEYACRAGTSTDYYYGSDPPQLGNYAWYIGNSGNVPHDAGGKLPNSWGLYDINGNCYEWCQDWYGSYSSGSQTDPTGPTSGTLRVIRGGSFDNIDYYLRCSHRTASPQNGWGNISLRLVMDAVEVVNEPTFNPAGETFTTSQKVTISCATTGATIRYTTDGSTPSQTNGAVIENGGQVDISATTVLKAIAHKTDMADSTVKTATYLITKTIMLPGNVPLELIKIQAGTFQMGDISGGHATEERPVHSVTISKPFYLSKYQVTQAQWQAVMNSNPSGFVGNNRPVETISWNDIQNYCQVIRAQTGYAVRLPSEAEWEYACRAGSTTDYFFGNEASQLGNYSWYGNNSGNVTHDVGGKQPNAWGLYDINGNVYEWCQDWYGPYSSNSQTDPIGPTSGTQRVIRGGSCYSGTDALRSSYRGSGGYNPSFKENSFGFRLALSDYRILHVSPSGNDANDGLTWQTAKKTVTAGLAAAQANDEVWVAAGTYVENITLKAGVALYGGFAGAENSLEQRNWRTNVTILDGNHAGSVVTSPQGATTSTRIDGFTIRNGTGTNTSVYRYGGGIFCYNSSPTIANNIITSNTASGNGYGYGGGICCHEGASPLILNNTITGNTANGSNDGYGGGIFTAGGSATIVNNIIANNTVTGGTFKNGGGIYCDNSTATITNNTIVGNTSAEGGGISCRYASPALANNIIAFCSSGVHNYGGTPSLQNNCVYGNTAYNYSGLTDPTGSSGNIAVDPKLIDIANQDWHLLSNSPCIDAGNDSIVFVGALDMDGGVRVLGQHVDIGADEIVASRIIYVCPSGNDANNGLTWQAAKRTVTAGLAAAGSGEQVWVAAGTYVGSVTLKSGVALYGGFAGDEVELAQRNWAASMTILDGNRADVSVVTLPPGATEATRIDGFTIRNGRGKPIGSYRYGGGIYSNGSSSTIINNTITGNVADYGGGIYCGTGSPIFANNIIKSNSSTYPGGGGGIHCTGSSPKITNNTITGNGSSSSSGCGGIYCSSAAPQIVNNIVAMNTSGICNASGTPLLRNNCIYNPNGTNYIGLSPGAGDISEDPKLVSIQYGQVHLTSDSPCIDTGDDDAVQSGWVDIDGQIRKQGAHVDIGVDEYDGIAPPPFASGRVYVNITGNDTNDGLTWMTAKASVSAGLNTAQPGDQVWVAKGTYIENITLKDGVALYGGFAGTESELDQRNWKTNETILDGHQSASSVVIAPLGTNTATRIDGFTICNGSGKQESCYRRGGGIYCDSASPTIANNTIKQNTAYYTYGYGGAIYSYCGSPLILNNIIKGNSTSGYYDGYGGGIFFAGGAPIVANNIITGNAVGGNDFVRGGGIYCDNTAALIINNAITENNAGDGGGIACTSNSSAFIANNIVAFNSSGIYKTETASPTLRYNCVYGNADYNYGAVADPTGTNGNTSVNLGLTADGHLRADSLCINAGSNEAVPADILTDCDGEARVAGSRVDIGPDEFMDSDADRLPDLWESRYWSSATIAEPNADPDLDGLTNLAEYEQYSSNPAVSPLYVDGIDGNDVYDGRSSTPQGGNVGPKRTIQAAINIANDGDTILVRAGTYAGTGNMNLNLGSRWLIIRAWNGLDPSAVASATIDCGGNGRAVNKDTVGVFAALEGFTITHGSADTGGGFNAHTKTIIMKNTTLTNNSASTAGGALWTYAGRSVMDNLHLQANNAPDGSSGALDGSNIRLEGGLYVHDGQLKVTSSQFDGPGAIEIMPAAAMKIDGTPLQPPTVVRSNLTCAGAISISPGAQLILGSNAVLDLANGQGRITVDGKLIAQDTATVKGGDIKVRQARITTTEPVQYNDILMIDGLLAGGEFFVQDHAKILNNVIVSEGDRYLDLDPDPSLPVHPEIEGNIFYVSIITHPEFNKGTLLELRARDYECESGGANPAHASGAYQCGITGRFTEDAVRNWVLESLEIQPYSKLNLTNRPGYVFRSDTTYPETVYVKTLKLHPGAVLNTALQTLYYETLVDENNAPLTRDPNDPSSPMTNGSKIVDEPLLGFSLGIIAMNDITPSPNNEFDLRVRKRVRDVSDQQGCLCEGTCDGVTTRDVTTCKEGSVILKPGVRASGDGVMEMKTKADNRQSGTSVAAKGSFARAGEDQIVIAFEYQFKQADDNTQIIVYLSDNQEIGEGNVEVAKLKPPAPGRAGSVGSSEFGIFRGSFPRGSLKMFRGTHVELELEGKNSSVWIDNWDPQITCGQTCGDIAIGGDDVTEADFLLLLAESSQTIPQDHGDHGCLDLNGDGYIDTSDLLQWDALFDVNLCPINTAMAVTKINKTLQTAVKARLGDVPTGTSILLAGKARLGRDDHKQFYDSLIRLGTNMNCSNAEDLPPAEGDYSHGRLIQDHAGQLYQIHGTRGLIKYHSLYTTNDDVVIVPPKSNVQVNNTNLYVDIGIVGEQSIPLLDAVFDPNNASIVYVTPVIVKDGNTAFRATAQLSLKTINNEADYDVMRIYGIPDDGTSDIRKAMPREIEISSNGQYLYVISAYASYVGTSVVMNNDWLLAFDVDTEGAPQAAVDLSKQVPEGAIREAIHGPSALHVTGDKLYMTASANTLSGVKTRVYRFDVTGTTLTDERMLDIDWPVNDNYNVGNGFKGAITAIEVSGDIVYVLGYSIPRFLADTEPGDLPYSQDTGMFTTASIAQIPQDATWSDSPPQTPLASENVTLLDCNTIALPISITVVESEDPMCNTPRMDTNGDLHVDATDFDAFSACYNGPTNKVSGDCLCIDSNGDQYVDAVDFDTFSGCYNGPTNPPRCVE